MFVKTDVVYLEFLIPKIKSKIKHAFVEVLDFAFKTIYGSTHEIHHTQ